MWRKLQRYIFFIFQSVIAKSGDPNQIVFCHYLLSPYQLFLNKCSILYEIVLLMWNYGKFLKHCTAWLLPRVFLQTKMFKVIDEKPYDYCSFDIRPNLIGRESTTSAKWCLDETIQIFKLATLPWPACALLACGLGHWAGSSIKLI